MNNVFIKYITETCDQTYESKWKSI